ncbi:MAG: 4-hydroxy-3-methylbut-2-enyl diphosphate reductase [Bacteroidia bacterium]|nr:4-hydroxy-3-methylbut-2-enyl diphosphate reductase [Bacteroidia bacterium]
MEVKIDPNSGFCFGVEYAIQLAEEELENGELYCLGDIVHNNKEVERLTAKGLKIIDHEELEKLTNCTVLIRAHGEPPQTYEIALKNDIQLLDASCPVVLKLQYRVKSTFDKISKKGGQVVVYGKEGHAEVNGLIGQTKNQAIIITKEADLDKIDYTKPIALFSQTTKSIANFYKIRELIEQRIKDSGNLEVVDLEMNDTICRQVSNRDEELRKFAKEHDVIIFASGKKSSNGKVLCKVCKEQNPNTYFISGIEDLNPEWFIGANSVGICGATSTPMWLMEEVGEAIKHFDVQKENVVV